MDTWIIITSCVFAMVQCILVIQILLYNILRKEVDDIL